jgi:hypothetical protein
MTTSYLIGWAWRKKRILFFDNVAGEFVTLLKGSLIWMPAAKKLILFTVSF